MVLVYVCIDMVALICTLGICETRNIQSLFTSKRRNLDMEFFVVNIGQTR